MELQAAPMIPATAVPPLGAQAGDLSFEGVQNTWDQHGVATEYLEQCKDCENDALTRAARIGLQLPRGARDVALQFMMYITRTLQKRQELWFQAASLLDAYSQKVWVNVEMLPATCVCIVRLVIKFDRDTDPKERAPWISLAGQMMQHPIMAGVVVPEITQEMLDSHERAIWGILDWQINVMTMHSWFMLFSTRLRLLSRDRYHLSALQIESRLPHRALTLARNEAATPEFSHFTHACGLFFIGLVQLDLIPLETLYSAKVVPSQADSTFWQMMLQGAPPRNVHTEEQSSTMLRMIELVTSSGQNALQQAAQTVVHRLVSIPGVI